VHRVCRHSWRWHRCTPTSCKNNLICRYVCVRVFSPSLSPLILPPVFRKNSKSPTTAPWRQQRRKSRPRTVCVFCYVFCVFSKCVYAVCVCKMRVCVCKMCLCYMCVFACRTSCCPSCRCDPSSPRGTGPPSPLRRARRVIVSSPRPSGLHIPPPRRRGRQMRVVKCAGAAWSISRKWGRHRGRGSNLGGGTMCTLLKCRAYDGELHACSGE